MTATVVTFPQGAVSGDGRVLRVAPHDGGAVVVLDATPFHPVDHTWPDQPGDSGMLRVAHEAVVVAEAVMAAQDDAGALFVGGEIPVKRGTDGWEWLVAHRIDQAPPAWLVPGVIVTADVEPARRSALSRGHTACHLASLALDLALADLWRKDPGPDALGAPDFEGHACQSSSIRPDGAIDEYRLGKSLRRAGFDVAGFAATVAERQARIDERLAGWLAAGGVSRIVAGGPTIVDRRRWECDLSDGIASIPCGGTHAGSLAAFAAITVTLDVSDPQLLVMTTVAVPAC